MRIVGLVTEYNPFHNGHLYHLEKSKEITKSEYSVAVMSGNFLQRGELALIDKWSRAQMAVDNGVDLVIELPTIYSCQSAEYFAYGAISILNNLGVINSVSFGSESGNLEIIDAIAGILNEEPEKFVLYLKSYLNTGIPFPDARTKALTEYMDNELSFKRYTNQEIKEVLSNPNNILGIEYLKAIKKLKSSLEPFTIKRIGAHYNAQEISGKISSATAIRNEIFTSESTTGVKGALSTSSFEVLENFLGKYRSFNSLKNFNDILLYILRTSNPDSLKEILDIEEGLENRIIKCSYAHNSILEILDCVKTKRYTYTRLQRILMHLLLGMSGRTFLDLHKKGPQYIRVLGFNKNGIHILNKAKKISKLPIITKFSSYRKINNEHLHKMIEVDKKATDIYFLGLDKFNGNKANLDFLKSPYVKS